ncbi:hypothetical protein PFICI_08553 [Pestalotiopsis fici W106-1]|uniref:Uncharacterized protein n=1 Tax=Pestalotiopsis fici (strain W106-1 / CGMCC3.15140) TaxID=1229662 RepID=W3WXX9_PESFW|nr:uncharacterized protein PFICI_08553 [Pestalotiopsis fici W106-1]ETS78700.1 hypothetical protein PFICI_08553 [Pestalotiopsis fici W106-1]
MPALCCCSSRGAYPSGDRSTPIAQLPARPAQARLPRAQRKGQNHDGPAVMIDTPAPSLVATPRQQAVLDPTVIEVDDSDSEDEPSDLRTPPTTALGALKTKLIRRLSQKSQSKRQSQQSIGSSEEELARRAELRRLRQKRIQGELSTETDLVNSGHDHVPSRRTSPSPSERPDITGGGPRDTIEFSVCDIDTATSNSSDSPAREMIAVALPIVVSTGTSLCRHGSCPTSATSPCEPSAPHARQALREHRSVPKMLLSPQMEPPTLSDTSTTSSVASWRLSYSAGHLAEYIGALPDADPESEEMVKHASGQQPTIPRNDANDDTERPHDERLPHAPDAPSRSSTNRRMDHENKSFAAGSHADETNFEQSTAIFHDTTHSEHFSPLDLWLRVSNTLQSISHSSTRRNSDSVLEGRPERPLLSDLDPNTKNARGRPSSSSSQSGMNQNLLKISSCFPTNEKLNAPSTQHWEPAEQLVQHTTLSRDDRQGLAVVNSPADPAPGLADAECTPSAQRNDTKRSAGYLNEIECDKASGKLLSDTTRLDSNDSGAEFCETEPAQTSTQRTVESERDRLHPTPAGLDPVSASVINEQAEMKTDSTDFCEQLQVRESIDSRLRPLVENSQARSIKKTSLFARLFPSKAKPRNTLRKHQSERDNSRTVNDGPRNHATPNSSQYATQERRGQQFSNEGGNLKLEETATDLWQRAVRLEAERREGCARNQPESQYEEQTPQVVIQDSRGMSTNDVVPTGPHTREASSVYSRSHNEDGSGIPSTPSRPLTGQDEMQITSTSLESSSRILKEWQHQVQTERSDAEQTPSFRTHIYATQRRQGVPESWAKWPSHDREERNGATGVDDLVTPKDFAVAEASVAGLTKWSTDKEIKVDDLDEGHATPERRSFSNKFGRTLRESLAKLRPERDGPNTNRINLSTHARKRPCSSGSLEYPELELLPQNGGYKELEALEKTIDHLKRPSMTSGTRSRGLSGASSRTPLSLRFAQEVQSLQNYDRSGSPDTGDFPNTVALQPPNTPVEKRELSQARSGASQQYGTPLTHGSYEDCVPTHMLDENDSAKSDTELAVRRTKSVLDLSTAEHTKKYCTWNGRSKSVSLKRLRASRSE